MSTTARLPHRGWRPGPNPMDRRSPGRTNRSKEVIRLRDEAGRKHCILCNDWKFEDQFNRQRLNADGLDSACQNCRRARRHGLSGAEFKALSALGCIICGSVDTPLVIDHDHACCPSDLGCRECVRGAICTNCNTGLGMFKDSRELLLAAAKYLDPLTRKRWHVNVSLDDYPLFHRLEQVAFDELDRQFMTGELEPGIAYESSYFDPASGEIQGIPNFSLVIKAIVAAYREEGY